MRRTILALTVISLAPTAVMASTSGRELVKDSDLGAAAAAIETVPVAPAGLAGSDPGGRTIILAKGDKSGTGPGAGGHKGQKKGEGKGRQAKGEDKGGGDKGGKGGPSPKR